MSAPEPPAPRRARPSARAARQKERAAPSAAPPYLTRAIPPYELLSEEGLGQVERHADQLLEEIGLEIRGDLEAIRLWRAAGARISGDWRVHVPRGLAREIVRRSAPREFTQHARNPARSVPLGGNHTGFAPAYGPPFVSDLDGGRRYGTLEAFREIGPGRRDQLQRANRRWKGLLEAFERPPLDAAREEALLDYVARRKRSMPDELG